MRLLYFAIPILLLLAPGATAQSVRGAIAGVVTDASSKSIQGATVTLTEEATNRKRAAVTDGHGEFLVTALPPGGYRLEVGHAGYRTHVQTLTLAVDQEMHVEVPLLAGNRTDTIVVTAARSMVKTDSAALGTGIENRNITGLPLDGRNFYELALLVPGAAPAAPGSAGSVRGDLALNINGAREDSNNFLLDGIYNGDPKLNTFGVTPPVDAIQEFEVLTSVYDASFGRNAGGQVNVVLKSGTNSLHGSAYEFFRNGALDARNFFAPADQPKPQYQRNQFGASLGGPIRKDRTFFFADYEGRRVRQGITQVSNVPTLAERTGDFSARYPAGDQPLHPAAVSREQDSFGLSESGGRGRLRRFIRLPNRAVPGENFVSSPTERDRDDHFDVRLDHSLARGERPGFPLQLCRPQLCSSLSPARGSRRAGLRRHCAAPRAERHAERNARVLVRSDQRIRAGYNRVSAGAFQQDIGHSVNSAVGLPDLSTKAARSRLVADYRDRLFASGRRVQQSAAQRVEHSAADRSSHLHSRTSFV